MFHQCFHLTEQSKVTEETEILVENPGEILRNQRISNEHFSSWKRKLNNVNSKDGMKYYPDENILCKFVEC